MTTVSRPNRDALDEALNIFRDAMRPFIVRHLRRVPGSTVEEAIKRSLPDRKVVNFERNLSSKGGDIAASIDVNDFPQLVQRNWRDTFAGFFGNASTITHALWLIADGRNQTAHPGTSDLGAEYVRTQLFHIADMLEQINAPEEAKAVTEIRNNLTATVTGTDQTPPVTQTPASEGEPIAAPKRAGGSLKPWREVIPPTRDVAEGAFQQAEFMADLQQVFDGRAEATIYGHPFNFFSQTYITPGLRILMLNTLRRLAGQGGDPVIQTKTGFGGGKTHSLIALLHLVQSYDALLNPPANSEHERTAQNIKEIAEAAGVPPEHGAAAAVAVLDGTYLASSDAGVTESGDPLNTLWAVMAYQLGGQAAYDIIGNAARQGTAPGGAQLDQLLEHVGPCLILMDELVAYARNATDEQRDRIYTFMQALTQSARRSSTTALVVTLPESSLETGGPTGAEALARLENILGRAEAVWEPLAVNEAFEVVRRRLFGQIADTAERDRTCESFVSMYGNSRREYPAQAGEQRYLERMKACYPIHPEVFDRLYSDWSSIQRFQKTRGVLRMMSTCVSRLYRDQSASPLIMPGDLPLGDPQLASEFDQLLPGHWGPVISEIDSDSGRTDQIDGTSQRFQEVGGAARRVARSIFLGSATSGATRGLDRRSLHLATVRPNEGVPRYNEALDRMVGDLYYLYHADDRYYFHAEENLNKVASDRKDALDPALVDEKIIAELKGAVGRRSDAIVCPPDSASVPDTDAVRLVVLSPGQSLSNRASEPDDAGPAALELLRQRGDAPRVNRNTLLFLAARKDEMRVLRDATRTWMAWHSINSGDEDSGFQAITNLTGERRRQVNVSLRAADTARRNALVRAYRWAMAPYQPDPQQADAYTMNSWQTTAAAQDNPGDIINSALDIFRKEEALLDEVTPSALEGMLQRYFWDNHDHIAVKDLWDTLTRSVYLFRLPNRTVLEQSVIAGVAEGKFGYADRHDGSEYQGALRFREPMADATLPLTGLLLNPVMAELEQEKRRQDTPVQEPTETDSTTDGGYTVAPRPDESDDGIAPQATYTTRPRHVVAHKTIESDVAMYDFNQLRDEIIRNLRNDGGDVTVEVIIRAAKDDGFSESITRAVRENSAQLQLNFTESDYAPEP